MADEALQEGEDRPEQQAHAIDQRGAVAVEHPAAGDLHGGVGPAEGRERQPHGDGVEAQLGPHRRGRDRERGPVDVVEGGDDEDQSQDNVARVRLPHDTADRGHVALHVPCPRFVGGDSCRRHREALTRIVLAGVVARPVRFTLIRKSEYDQSCQSIAKIKLR
ncbi:protein of unknown function [Rhodovastum atsumiense]|nr:protein of unknown function [Rhodovastum atsumiense]